MTLLANLVGTSERVAATAARQAKIRELAALLKALARDEIAIAALYLSGELPQGRIGIGFASLHAAASVRATSFSGPFRTGVSSAPWSTTAIFSLGAPAPKACLHAVGGPGDGIHLRRPTGVHDLHRSFIHRMPIRLRFLRPFKPEH